jgi:hypothetical protein
MLLTHAPDAPPLTPAPQASLAHDDRRTPARASRDGA